MEEILNQSQIVAIDKAGSVIVDIDSLTQTQTSDKCSGSPKVTKALSRKGSNRMERRIGNGEEQQEAEEASRKLVVKLVCPQLEQLKQPSSSTTATSNLGESGDGRNNNKRFNRLTTIHPRKILLLFATMSSMGTMILIYFTLAINRRGEA
ncbi:hypothetical protein QJS10_CPA03g02536 [Acorus calamus]|uniref:Uncharacterized protein n=1 Tax=Acorus calamus TaxID=4465 RepID=A0AAV9F4F7_ACOCL|nr:hypothetical protein QJS10_CPA03g02536 [Acorus calamus]